MNGFIKLYTVLASFEATVTERRDAKGVTAIEYALMAAAIATMIGVAMVALSTKITGLFNGL